jgi:hypothetical protein
MIVRFIGWCSFDYEVMCQLSNQSHGACFTVNMSTKYIVYIKRYRVPFIQNVLRSTISRANKATKLYYILKRKAKKYRTVGTVLTFNIQIVGRGKLDIPTHKYMLAHLPKGNLSFYHQSVVFRSSITHFVPIC